jgi:hypothetical protein
VYGSTVFGFPTVYCVSAAGGFGSKQTQKYPSQRL